MHPNQAKLIDRVEDWLDRWLGNAPDWVGLCVGESYLFVWALCHYRQVKQWYYFDAMEQLTGVDKEPT